MRNIAIIIVVVLCCFGITVFNGFVGDDHMLFGSNTFYRHFENVPRIFTPRFVTAQDISLSSIGVTSDRDSGLVSYRPTAIIFYFLDYAFFGLHPAGYHVHNVLWHVMNCILVYLIIYYMTFNAGQALMVALLFAVHPTHSEAVSVISYRNDLIVAFYLLMSFLLYVRFRKTGNQPKFYLASLLFFCLGVFAKEYAVVFPMILVVYDEMFYNRSIKEFKMYLPFFVVVGFYLWIYKFLIPNGVFGHANSPITLINHLTNVGWINALYIRDIFLPWYAKVWPPQTMPAFVFSPEITMLVAGLVVLAYFYLFVYFFWRSKLTAFFLFWSALFWLPVSDLVVKPSPISQRFYYLPSLGLLFVVAMGLMWIVEKMKSVKILPSFKGVFCSSIIGMCLVFCVYFNSLWKSDFIIASYWTDSFPPSVKSLSILGTSYVAAHDYVRAKECLLKAYSMKPDDFDTLIMLSKVTQDNPPESRKYLAQLVDIYSQNYFVFYSIGESYFTEKNYAEAMRWFQKTLQLRKERNVYGMTILSAVYSGKFLEAKEYLWQAMKYLDKNDSEFLIKELEKIQKENPSLSIPKL